MKKLFLSALFALCLFTGIASAEPLYKIFLKNGKTIMAEEIEQDESSVTIYTPYGRIELQNSQITSILEIARIEEKKEEPAPEPQKPEVPAQPEQKIPPDGQPVKEPVTAPPAPEPKIAESAEPPPATPLPPFPSTLSSEKTNEQLRIDAILMALAAKQEIDKNSNELAVLAKTNRTYLIQLLDADKDIYSYWAAFGLSKLDNETIGNTFLKRLNHPYSDTRGIMVTKLGTWKNNAAVRETFKINFSLETNNAVKLRYIYGIKDLHITECIDALFQCMQGQDTTIAAKARETIVSLAKYAEKTREPLDIVSVINDQIALSTSETFMMELVKLIGDLKAPEYYDSLKKLVEKRSEKLTIEVIKALKKFEDKSLTRYFTEIYESETSENIRISAIKAIDKTKDSRSIDFLIEKLANPSTTELVKDAVVHALENISKQNFNYDVEQWREWWKKMTTAE
ncbi:MAG: HEAT repeat domain-containing protein [Planctomycetes bacterium]|nr:HEAT repeat domain-containing protein [Planctomycetota bacterium]